MRIGVRIYNVQTPEKFVDVIITYRWWVPGKDPWQVESRTSYVPTPSGEWVDWISYSETGHSIDLEDENKSIFSLTRLPHWPPSNFKIGDEGRAYQHTYGTANLYYNAHEEIRWKIRWIG